MDIVIIRPGESKRLDRIEELLEILEKGQHHTMAQIDDLKTAVARSAASASAEIKAVSDKLDSLGSNEPAIAEAIASLNKTSDTLDAETATLTAPVPPPV